MLKCDNSAIIPHRIISYLEKLSDAIDVPAGMKALLPQDAGTVGIIQIDFSKPVGSLHGKTNRFSIHDFKLTPILV